MASALSDLTAEGAGAAACVRQVQHRRPFRRLSRVYVLDRKDVLRAKRATLSDAKLERLVFVKVNRQMAGDK